MKGVQDGLNLICRFPSGVVATLILTLVIFCLGTKGSSMYFFFPSKRARYVPNFFIGGMLSSEEDPNKALLTRGLFGRVAQYLAERETFRPTYLGSRPRKHVLSRSSESQAT